MTTDFLKRIKLNGIHKRYNLDLKLKESLNVLYGHNGSGKTTLLHIIANILNRDFLRFAFLDFNSIRAEYFSGNWIEITQIEEESERLIKISTQDNKSIQFSRAEAADFLRKAGGPIPPSEYLPIIVRKLDDFLKENKLQQQGASYFPAFRTMLEAWSLNSDLNEARQYSHRRAGYIGKVTDFAREIFGNFLPKINFPSPLDIEANIREEIRDAHIQIGRYESSVFSESFVKIFSALLSGGEGSTQDANELLREISELTSSSISNKFVELEENENTYRKLQLLMSHSQTSRELAGSAVGALTVYRDALRERKEFQIKVFEQIDKYFSAVNAFLDNKKLAYEPSVIRRYRTKVGLQYPDGSWSSVRVMSSGERQLLTILYAATKMSDANTVLIDEPELSLHIDWQEELLGKMMGQFGNRQIIVCTHSPAISSAYDEYMTEIIPQLLKVQTTPSVESKDDEDEDL